MKMEWNEKSMRENPKLKGIDACECEERNL